MSKTLALVTLLKHNTGKNMHSTNATNYCIVKWQISFGWQFSVQFFKVSFGWFFCRKGSYVTYVHGEIFSQASRLNYQPVWFVSQKQKEQRPQHNKVAQRKECLKLYIPFIRQTIFNILQNFERKRKQFATSNFLLFFRCLRWTTVVFAARREFNTSTYSASSSPFDCCRWQLCLLKDREILLKIYVKFLWKFQLILDLLCIKFSFAT